MKYLLDTHILIWCLFDSSKLSVRVKDVLFDPTHTIYVSSVAFWEISIKFNTGKIGLGKYYPNDLPAICQEMGFDLIDLRGKETASFYQLKAEHHRDPFDRILIWQAIENGYTLISDDDSVKKYISEGLKVIW